ncbi:MAG: superoxide dismutase [Burkholderiales bacterium]
MIANVAARGSTKHLLPPLPYEPGALEPHIDARTMVLHHDMHHASYVAALNSALEAFPELQGRTASWLLLHLSRVPEKIRAAVHHAAGGHVNHGLFWRAMSPKGARAPTGLLAEAIERDFGGFEPFKARFEEAGAKLFGSGWVWLVRAQKDGGRLQVTTTSGHDHPLMQGHFPLLLNDVWEHAYYLKHQNRRADYLKGWWSVANWGEAAGRFQNSDHGAEERWESDGGSLLEATT